MGRTIVIANQKGGVGKTTTAVNLSACLADMGRRVLLLDIDPQGNATSGMGIEKKGLETSVYEVLTGAAAAQEAILPTAVERLSLLPSSIDLAGAEIELVSLVARETVLARALEPVRQDYDFIIIDPPPSLGLLTINALSAADQVLVPIQCEFYALEGLSQLINTVMLVKKHINARLEIEGVVLTMFDSRTNLSVQVQEEVRKFFAGRVHRAVIPRNVRLGEAPSYGLPISRYDASCVGAQAYQKLAREVLGTEEDDQ